MRVHAIVLIGFGACREEDDDALPHLAYTPEDTRDPDTFDPDTLFDATFEVDCPTMPTATLPAPGPLSHPTTAQIEEVKQCDLIDLLYDFVYAGSVCPENACEWAAATVVQVLTDPTYGYAYVFPAAEGSLAETVRLNPGFLLNELVLAAMFFSQKADAPPAPEVPVTDIALTYTWSGSGDPVEWDLAITGGDTHPVIAGTVDGEPFTDTVLVEDVQKLGSGFTDLLPIDEWVNVTPCFDNYPDWTMQITWEDGTSRDLATHLSNASPIGGPWQAEIEGQRYLQTSPVMVALLLDLLGELDLPYGEPAYFVCGPIFPPLIEQAYPTAE